jgi:sugar O-acyltransferase (sialic acid O-acetyltransferase NeuD family)
MRPLFIIGTGGQARDLADIADALNYRAVFVFHDRETIANWSREQEVVHEDEAFAASTEHFAIGIGDNRIRSGVAARLRATLRFPSLIHPDTSFGRGSRGAAEAAIGTAIFAGARLTNNVAVGDFCTVNLNATLSHDVELGDFANVSPGASIAGNVRIGEGAWIGVGAAVNQGTDARKLEIGAWTTIGSGAVVLRDCEPNSVYAGVPARKMR